MVQCNMSRIDFFMSSICSVFFFFFFALVKRAGSVGGTKGQFLW